MLLKLCQPLSGVDLAHWVKMVGLEMCSEIAIAVFCKYITVLFFLSNVACLLLSCVLLPFFLLYMWHFSLCSSTNEKRFSSEWKFKICFQSSHWWETEKNYIGSLMKKKKISKTLHSSLSQNRKNNKRCFNYIHWVNFGMLKLLLSINLIILFANFLF